MIRTEEVTAACAAMHAGMRGDGGRGGGAAVGAVAFGPIGVRNPVDQDEQHAHSSRCTGRTITTCAGCASV